LSGHTTTKESIALLFHSQNEQSVQMKIETSCRLQFFKLLLPLAYEITLAPIPKVFFLQIATLF
jgi:hypothetical protein